MADKVKIGTMWLGGCSGCHLSIADFHESLIDVMDLADFEFSPVLMDTKYDEVPELDVIIVEGGIRNDENRELAEMLNEKAKLVIAYGTCSCYGGIPGLGNLFTVEELEEEAYINSVSTVNPEGIIPNEDVPALESRVRPLDAVMDVDLMIPGCPPRSDVVAEAVLTLLRNETIEFDVATASDASDSRLEVVTAWRYLNQTKEDFDVFSKELISTAKTNIQKACTLKTSLYRPKKHTTHPAENRCRYKKQPQLRYAAKTAAAFYAPQKNKTHRSMFPPHSSPGGKHTNYKTSSLLSSSRRVGGKGSGEVFALGVADAQLLLP